MDFQEYIILIQDFNNYTVFMHNTCCVLSSGFWTLIQNIRSSGIGWLTWSPSWWTAMTWWCQRSSSSTFTRLALPFCFYLAGEDLISLTSLSLSQDIFALIVYIMVSIRILFPVPKLISIPCVLTGCTDIIIARKFPLSHSIWCNSIEGQRFIFKMNNSKWNCINK